MADRSYDRPGGQSGKSGTAEEIVDWNNQPEQCPKEAHPQQRGDFGSNKALMVSQGGTDVKYFGKLGLASSLAALALAFVTGSDARAADPIKLGVIMPTSGGVAALGNSLTDGIKLAVEEINAAGGVNGSMLEIVARDSQAKPDIASAAAKELISKEGVKVIIGPLLSGTGLAVSEVAKQEKIVNFAPSSKTEALTAEKLHKYIFQLAATTDVDAKRFSDLLNKIGAKKVCLVGFDYAYTTDLHRGIQANLNGFEITKEYLVKLGSTDYNTLISELLADPCDTIMGSIFGGGFVAFAKQGAPFGLFKNKKLVWGAQIGNYETLAALKGDFPEGLWTQAADLWYYEGSEAHKNYLAALAKLQGRKETDMWPITGYGAVKFIAAAMQKAGSTDPDKVAEALEGLSIEGPLGTLTMDAKTHRANAPEFYGQVATVPGTDVKQMTKIEIVR
ncbi:MAG: ABC transporter substrate-binding protein [Rhodobiaceae bacterium]|nr:ABC transporter substrate-binding protein [Rhodobiaceae bacterium]